MLMMFRLNQQALLLIQPLLMWQVFAETARKDYNNEMVSSGEKVVLICNISEKDTTQINWSKGRYVLAFHIKMNRTYSNFSSDRVRIDLDLPTKLIIISAQPDDAGLYTCNLTGAGMNSIGWNLTVSENPKEIIPSEDFVYALPLAIGLLLCGIMSAVCLCRTMEDLKSAKKGGVIIALSRQKMWNQDTESGSSPGPVPPSVRTRGGSRSTTKRHGS
ncbi:uncharacterized protein [Embiotoca jacksoni]|uniref:uncharacterized protein isoform X1 n=1 Tax=Embiotoca jacksoni TaxID=100190 RepID=UPI00370415F6